MEAFREKIRNIIFPCCITRGQGQQAQSQEDEEIEESDAEGK